MLNATEFHLNVVTMVKLIQHIFHYDFFLKFFLNVGPLLLELEEIPLTSSEENVLFIPGMEYSRRSCQGMGCCLGI